MVGDEGMWDQMMKSSGMLRLLADEKRRIYHLQYYEIMDIY